MCVSGQQMNSSIKPLYCNGFDQRAARQQPVNTFQHTLQATMEEPVFSVR
jgi:hypothetical protein